MKKFFLALRMTAMACAAGPLMAQSSSNFCLFSVSSEAEGRHSYWLPWSSLPSRVVWNPGAGPLPVVLDEMAETARVLLVTHEPITNRLELDGIEIFRIKHAKEVLEAHGVAERQLMDNWALSFSFSLVNPVRYIKRSVVLLMDGTQAEDRNLGRPSGQQVSARPPTSEAGRVAPSAAAREAATKPNKTSLPEKAFGEWVRKSDFEPRVQWDPTRHRFPLELGAQVDRVREHLSRQEGASPDLVLDRIRIVKYVPWEAIRLRREELAEHRNHWAVLWQFNPSSHQSDGDYFACMLLDGTIVESRKY
jgi:hypothetical protein